KDDRAFFIAAGDHLEKEIGLLTPEWQIADFIDDQELRHCNGAMHGLLQAALTLRRLQCQHQVGSRGKTHPPAPLGGEYTQGDGKMGLAGPRWPQEYDVLGTLDKSKARQFLDLLARRAGGEGKIIVFQRLDGRKPRAARQNAAGAHPPG